MDILTAGQNIEADIKQAGYSIKYRKSLTGCVWPKTKLCEIPEIKTRKSLYIACHELSHVLGNHYESNGLKRYEVEYKAEKFAHDKMRELGFPVPHSMTKRAHRYIFRKVLKAQRRGLKKLNKEVLKGF